MNENEGIVFNIQRYSIDDGPGVRTTVFMKGCPLSCLWCSNPESQKIEPEVTWRYTSCKRCGTCVRVCPQDAVTLDDDGVHIDRSKCDGCGVCVSSCVPEALKISGKKMTVDEVFDVVKRDATYYLASGGGVTASGGEILMQADFVAALFKKCHEAGYKTNADTCGYGTSEAYAKILEHSDLCYFDLKHLDPVLHKQYTGVSNEQILANLKLLAESGVPFVIRVPFIPGYNDSDENITALAKTVSDLAPGATVNLLPYHNYGANKYRMIDKTYSLDDVKRPTEDSLKNACSVIESFGLVCEISK